MKRKVRDAGQLSKRARGEGPRDCARVVHNPDADSKLDKLQDHVPPTRYGGDMHEHALGGECSVEGDALRTPFRRRDQIFTVKIDQ